MRGKEILTVLGKSIELLYHVMVKKPLVQTGVCIDVTVSFFNPLKDSHVSMAKLLSSN